MTKKYCHRCLMSFKCDIRLVMHLNKKNKCKIINDNYNVEYEKKLINLIDIFNHEYDTDCHKYITKLNNGYQCNLCKYQLPDKYQMKRHLMQLCLRDKYTPREDLVKLIEYAVNPTEWLSLDINNYEWEIYEKYVFQPKNTHNYLCKICANLFENKIKVAEHLRNECLSYECKDCGGRFSKSELIVHENIGCQLAFIKIDDPSDKPKIKELEYKSLIKPKIKFKHKLDNSNIMEIESNYDQYINIEKIAGLNEREVYRCELCQSLYDTKKDIQIHISQTHADEIGIDSLTSKNFEQKVNAIVEKKMNDLMEQKMNHIKPQINNNHMNFYLHDNGNTLQIMEERGHSFNQSLDFIKDCALSHLSGDLRLIEKLYIDIDQPAIFYLDKSKKKLYYKDEQGQEKADTNGLVGRKLASNLQNGYLYGINYLINENLEEKKCPMKFLQDYDIHMWNSHIYELADTKYQKKLISYADIPIKNK